jgi:hypothetical protein
MKSRVPRAPRAPVASQVPKEQVASRAARAQSRSNGARRRSPRLAGKCTPPTPFDGQGASKKRGANRRIVRARINYASGNSSTNCRAGAAASGVTWLDASSPQEAVAFIAQKVIPVVVAHGNKRVHVLRRFAESFVTQTSDNNERREKGATFVKWCLRVASSIPDFPQGRVERFGDVAILRDVLLCATNARLWTTFFIALLAERLDPNWKELAVECMSGRPVSTSIIFKASSASGAGCCSPPRSIMSLGHESASICRALLQL